MGMLAILRVIVYTRSVKRVRVASKCIVCARVCLNMCMNFVELCLLVEIFSMLAIIQFHEQKVSLVNGME